MLVPSHTRVTVIVLFIFLSDGLAICTLATGDNSSSLSGETLSTGMTGRPLLLRSNLSEGCGTCSGTRGVVSSFQTLLLPLARILIPPQDLLFFLLRLEPAEQDPDIPPSPLLPTVSALCLPNHGKHCLCSVTIAMFISVGNKSCLIWPFFIWWCCAFKASTSAIWTNYSKSYRSWDLCSLFSQPQDNFKELKNSSRWKRA